MLNLLFTRMQNAGAPTPRDTAGEDVDDDAADAAAPKSSFSTPTLSRKPAPDSQTEDNGNKPEAASTEDDATNHDSDSHPPAPPAESTTSAPTTPAATTTAAANGPTTPQPKAVSAADQAYRDCYQTFRGLCKLSMKKIPPNVSNMDSIEVRSKILSLELILSIFDNNTHVFKDHVRFINNALKKNLVLSIMLNGTSSISLVYRTTLAIFVCLVKDFRYHFKVPRSCCLFSRACYRQLIRNALFSERNRSLLQNSYSTGSGIQLE
jgi:brefeldin A-inhibited guanine nucleotide-exchange protein